MSTEIFQNSEVELQSLKSGGKELEKTLTSETFLGGEAHHCLVGFIHIQHPYIIHHSLYFLHVGREAGGGFRMEGTHVYLWLIHIDR